MMASKYAKSLGCESLEQVSRVSGIPVPTLQRWFRSKPDAFRVVCVGVVNSK